MNTLADRLKQALLMRGMSQSELARKVGLTRGAISHVVKGDTKTLSAEAAVKICDALNIKIHWLIFGEGKISEDTFHPEITEELKEIFKKLPKENQLLTLSIIKQLSKP